MTELQNLTIEPAEPLPLVWNEQRAAALLAFAEEETVTPSPEAEPDAPPPSPRDQTSTPSLGKSPLAKLGIVGAASLGVFALAGLIFNSLGRVTAPAASPPQVQAAEGSLPLDTELDLGQPDKEKASLLTEAALGKQEAQLAALKPQRSAQSTKPLPQPRPVAVKPAPSSVSTPLPPPPPVLPPAPSLPVPAMTPPPDPNQQWLAASTAGSYGQVMVPPPPTAVPEVPQINPTEEAAILNYQPGRQLMVGTQAAARLVTPILHEALPQDAKPATPWRFTVRLEAPLSTASGTVVFPAGTTLTAEVASLGASGLLNLSAIAAVVEGREYPLPPQAVTIRGAEGQPLIAQKYHDPGGEIAGMDAALVLFGGLAKVGELVNRPQSTASISTGLGGVTTATQNPPANLVAAALEGGFSTLSQQVGDRNQKALQSALTRANLWFVEPGTPVQVFVNQTIQL